MSATKERYIIQYSNEPVGEYAPISARLLRSRNFIRFDYDRNPFFDEAAWALNAKCGKDPHQVAHLLASPLPEGLYDTAEGVVFYQSRE
jgi:hypothetical protein